MLRTTKMALCTAINSLRDGYAFYRRNSGGQNEQPNHEQVSHPPPRPSVGNSIVGERGKDWLNQIFPYYGYIVVGLN